MEPARPVDGYVGLACGELCASKQSACCVALAVLIHVVEHRAITVSEAVCAQLICVALFVLHGDVLEAVDVVVAVEDAQVDVVNIIGIKVNRLHLFVQLVASDQRIGHFNAQRLHRVGLADLEHRKVLIVVVADTRLPRDVVTT